MDIEYADNDIGQFDGWMDGWIVHVNESNFADLSEDETVVILPSYPDNNGVRVIFMPIYQVIDDTSLNMELETMDIVDMVASSDIRCCSM